MAGGPVVTWEQLRAGAGLGTAVGLLCALVAAVASAALGRLSAVASRLDRECHAAPQAREAGAGAPRGREGHGAGLPLVEEPEPRVFLSVVIPAYNERERLPEVLAELLGYLRGRAAADAGFTWEVVLVDDGSRDGTVEAAEGVAAECRARRALRVVRHLRNMGKGYAVRMGFLHARGDLILFMDADGATEIPEIGKMEQAVLEELRGAGPEPGPGTGPGRGGGAWGPRGRWAAGRTCRTRRRRPAPS